MAGSVKGITVEIGGDTSKLGKALESSEKQSRDLQKELKQVNTALKFNPNNVELLTQKQKLLSDQIKATTDKLNILKEAEAQVAAQFESGEIGEEQYREFQREIIETESKLKSYQAQLDATGKKASALDELTNTIQDQEAAVEQLKSEYKEAVLTYGKNSDEAKKLAKQIKDLSGELKENKDKMSDADNAADDLDESLEDVGDGADKANEGFTVLKGTLANLAADAIRNVIQGLTDIAKEAFNVGMSFESSMSNNAALFKATDEELQKLSDTAKHYGETTQFSASEAADALGYMALAGWDADKAISELGGVLELAAASGMGLAEASDMVTDYMSAFSNSAMTAAEFADKLAYAQANSNTTAQQLGEAFKNSAANLNAAGQDVETVTALLAAMANQGLKGSEAGTALSAMMRDLTAKMEDGAVKIGDTSVAVMDAEGNYRDLTDILKDVEKATEGMGDAEKAAALSSTFTADSIKGLNLILNDGVDKSADFEDALRNCDGAAADMAATMNDNVAGSLKLLKSNIESKMIKVFDSAKGSIKGAIGSMSAALDSIDWDKVADAVGRFAQKIADLFTYLVNNADTVKKVLAAIGILITTVFAVNKIAGFITSIGTLKTAFTKLWAVMAANPILLVAGAVAALMGAVVAFNRAQNQQIKDTYGLSEAEQELINKINEEKKAIEEAAAARKEANQAIDAEYGQNQKLWQELQSIIDANGKIKKGYEERAAVITGLLAESLGVEIKIVDGQIQKYDELKQSIEDVIRVKRAEALLEANKGAYTEAIQKSAEAYTTYTKAVSEAQATAGELAKAEGALAQAREEMNNNTYAEGQEMFNQAYLKQAGIVETLTEKYNNQKQAVSDAESNYLSYANTIDNYEGVMAAMASGDVEALSQALDRLSNNFMTAENATKEMLQNQLTSFQEQYANMKAAVEAGMPGVTQANVDAMADLVAQAEAELDKLEPKAEEAGKKSGDAHAKGVESAASENKKAGQKLAADANAGMESKNTKATGKKKGEDYASGVGSTAKAAGKAGGNLAAEVEGGLASADTKGTGSDIGKDYVQGVKNADKDAAAAGKNLGESADKGAGSVKPAKTGEKTAKDYVKGVTSQSASANAAGKKLASNARSGAGSVSAYGSGVNFSQGFINGINSLLQKAYNTAYNLGKKALEGLKRGQREGSPSKLTYQSGVFFDQGYINAIKDKTGEAVKAAQEMAKKTVAALGTVDVSDALFGDMGINGATFGRQIDNTFSVRTNTPDFSEILNKLDAVTAAIAQYSGNAIVLDTGVLVGETINQIDDGLSGVYGLKKRGI